MRTKDQEKSEEQDLLTSSYSCYVTLQFIISANPPGYINTLQTSGYWRLSRPWRHWPSSYRPPADQLHNIHTSIFCTASASLREAALPQTRDPGTSQHFAMKSQSPRCEFEQMWRGRPFLLVKGIIINQCAGPLLSGKCLLEAVNTKPVVTRSITCPQIYHYIHLSILNNIL